MGTKTIEAVNNSKAALEVAGMLAQVLLPREHFITQHDALMGRTFRGRWLAELGQVLAVELLSIAEDGGIERAALYAHEREEDGTDVIHGVVIYRLTPLGIVIEDLGVDAAHRRKKVGTELVRALEAEALRLGRTLISFVVHKEDREAMMFWARTGYGPEGVAFARELERPKVMKTVDGKPLIVPASRMTKPS